MAIFETSSQSIIILDDTEKLFCEIENAQNINKHTEYNLKVRRGVSNKWNVSRRYKDFVALQHSLQQSNIVLPLPPKKLIGNMQPSFIAERQIALQNYINEVLKYHILALSLQVRSFLDPVNYSTGIQEQALQTVSIALRGNEKYEFKGPLLEIGWRIRKHYFIVTDINQRDNCLLAWQSYGPDKHLTDKDLQSAFKSLQSISHPYIDTILGIQNLETGVYVVRKIHESGSVRDILYGTEYNKHHLAKYGNPKLRKTFTLGQISHYGFQILQALKFLHDKGFPYGHLHPGNIVIENNRALLTDIENSIIGSPCLYRSYIIEHKRLCSMEAVDVYCFGRSLYEMTFGVTLEQSYCDTYPEGISGDLESVLRLCLSSASFKHHMPTIDNLLEHPFFTQTFTLTNGLASNQDCPLHLKFPIALKEELWKVKTTIEARLKYDQKLIRSAKREVRIQEILNSEEELRKQKKKVKKRDSMWKSTSSLAETVRSHSMSTTSSPTPPHLPDASVNTSMSVTPTSPQDGRSALLTAICSFDKSRLARINSR